MEKITEMGGPAEAVASILEWDLLRLLRRRQAAYTIPPTDH